MATQERISTPRGSFCVTALSRQQMGVAEYGVHHQSDDGKYLILANGTRAFAVLAQQPEQDNPRCTAEMTLENDYDMINGLSTTADAARNLRRNRSTQRRRSLPSGSGWRILDGSVPVIRPRRAKAQS